MGIEAIALSIMQITAVAAVGLFLWHVFGRRFDAVDDRFDRFEADVNDKFDRLEADVNDKFDRLEANVDAKFDRFEANVDVKFGRLEADVDVKSDRFAASVHARFGSLEAKVDELAKDHQNLARELSEFRGEMRGRLDAVFPTPASTS